MNWEAFLEIKCGDDINLFNSKKQKIQIWQLNHPIRADSISDASRKALAEEIATVSNAIDSAWQRLREGKNNRTQL
jgi:hypothetical protein